MMTTQELRVALRNHIGVDEQDTGFDDAGANLFLNRSLWEVIEKFRFKEKEREKKTCLTIGQPAYEVPEFIDAIQRIAVLEENGEKQHHLLNRIDESVYEQMKETSGRPTSYFRRNDAIVLFPTPDKAYDLILYYTIRFQDIEAEGLILPSSWYEIILFGAIYRGLLQLRMYDAATNIKNIQVGLINSSTPTEAKEERDSRYAKVSVYIPEYP